MNLARKIFEANKLFNLIEKGDKILIGFSGGVDSMVLSCLMYKLKDALGIEIGLAHFNHHLREDADEDEAFCIDFAKSLKLPIYVESFDIKSLKGNIEENARKKRYEFLQKTSKKEGYNKIATAHHLDDLAETMILWFVRGGGLKGLSGFKAYKENIIRPLITATKDEIRAFAKEQHLNWKEDYTNYDETISRNLIRHKVIPILKTINPNFLSTVLQESIILQDEEAFLEDYTEHVIKNIDVFDVKSLKQEPRAIQRRIVRKTFGTKTFQKTELVLRLLENAKKIKLSKDKSLVVKHGKIKEIYDKI
ncbi:tRNA(Ile)-lysidine synthetase [Hydrogenobaculum sp. Y04AAS1]|uniref:tRNA lysidine(34) synthetase TilS n=1 Tax=Hydrogenobaculum sp. (strain Y04AAS1) TaxID=380749 RepID=UPI00015BD271|nr:tRNA(Ile)-lysidine synthetase [Hydrogenobaculum sp. Y04AAS1]HCT66671.1 tRNA lysidine(34) synthetase TilS [Hydrogenobaculum sp.]